MRCPQSSACAYPLSGPSAGVRRSHLVCLWRNGGTIQITAAGVSILPQPLRCSLSERVQLASAASSPCVSLWHVFNGTSGTISDNLARIVSAKIPLSATLPVLEVRKGCFRGKVRRLFSRREYPQAELVGQINKLERTDLMDMKMLYSGKIQIYFM